MSSKGLQDVLRVTQLMKWQKWNLMTILGDSQEGNFLLDWFFIFQYWEPSFKLQYLSLLTKIFSVIYGSDHLQSKF